MINPKNILFRADSSSTIGTGHIMRDLVLADQFKNSNIIFATQGLPGNINHKIKEKKYTIEILSSNNIEELTDVIKKHNINMIIIDHYGIDHNYEKALKESAGITILVLDDTYEKHYCDILLNHNIYAESSKYKNRVPENCSHAQTQMTPEQSDELFELRAVGRDIVEAIKDTKHLHKNLITYIASDNQYIRDEYNQIRAHLIAVLRSLEEARGGGDILSLDNLKVEMKQNDTTANGTLEVLIHEDKISAEMATSLMNDTSYAQDVIKNLLQMGEVLFATGDLDMKAAERSLALDDTEMLEILDSQKD